MKQTDREELTVSDHKAFAKFPAAGGNGAYQYIDVFEIEAIGQSSEPTGAVIFGRTERYYSIVIPQEELERAGEPDAASWCLSLMLKVAQMELGIVFQESEADGEDDFDVPPNAG